jgi:hypothetical protein
MKTIKDSEFLPVPNKPLYGSVGYLRINVFGYHDSESTFRIAINTGETTYGINVPEDSEWMPIYNSGREPKGFRRLLLKLRMIWKIIKSK